MAADYLKLNTTTQHGGEYWSAVVQLRTAESNLRTLKARFEKMIDGSDYTMLEANTGLSAGQGVQAYNLLAGAVAGLAAGDLQQLLARLA